MQADRHGETPPVERPQVDIACVQVDGGRIQTRAPDRIIVCHVTPDDVTGCTGAEFITAPAGLPKSPALP